MPNPGSALAPPRPDAADVPESALAVVDPEIAACPSHAPLRPRTVTEPVHAARVAVPPEAAADEPKGCLYALSQPPLMLFLCVVGGLIGSGAAWDLLFL